MPRQQRNKGSFPGTGKKESYIPFKSKSHKRMSEKMTKAKKHIKRVAKETGKDVSVDDYLRARRKYKS